MSRTLSALLLALCLASCAQSPDTTPAPVITKKTTIDLEKGGIVNTRPLADFTDPSKKPKCLGKEDDSFR